MKTARITFILGLAAAIAAPAFGQALTGTSLNVNSAGASALTGTLTVSGVATFNNNLVVTGWADVMNNQFTLGASGTVFSNWLFTDSSTDTLANVLNRGSASWLWAHGTTGAPVPAMRLDSAHQLLLFNAAGTTAGITLTPVSNKISLGTATLTGAGTTLTAGGAFGLGGPSGTVLTASGTNLSISGGSLVNTPIGATTPSTGAFTTLSATGTVMLGSTGTGTNNELLVLDGGSGTGGGGILYFRKNAIAKGQLGNESALFNTNSDNIGLYMPTGSNFDIFPNGLSSAVATFSGNGLSVTALNTTGNVGVGTPTPEAKLQVLGGNLFVNSVNDATGGLYYGGASNGLIIGKNATSPWPGTNGLFVGGNAMLMGNVGIGTTSPGAKFAVAGGDVQVESGQGRFKGWYNAGSGLGAEVGISGGSGYLITYDRTAGTYGTTSISSGTAFLNVNTNGNVGIGTSSPEAKLQVLGGNLFVNSVNDATGGLYYGGASNGLIIGKNATSPWPGINGLFVGGNSLLMGNVGIGTTNIFKPLTVEAGSATGVNQGLVINSSHAFGVGQGAASSALVFSRNRTTDTSVLQPQSQIVGGSESETTSAYGYLSFFTTDAAGTQQERMHIDSAGNVGIGTAIPGTYKLAVKGSIHAQEVVVDNANWADYVFDSSYRLAPLSEVEQHIKAEKHLPGIPSAQEIAEHGVSMGDMQSKLLSKIEELTLHMIQMEKENTELRQRVQKLEATTANP